MPFTTEQLLNLIRHAVEGMEQEGRVHEDTIEDMKYILKHTKTVNYQTSFNTQTKIVED